MSYQAARGKKKTPTPRYQYKFATVLSSPKAARFEKALGERLVGSGLSFFAICHENGHCDVMGDSGPNPLAADDLRAARAVADEIKKAYDTGAVQ